MTLNITPAQVTLAQMGKTVTLEKGYFLRAVACGNGWKYNLSWENQSGYARYTGPGIEAARWAVNAPDEEYAADSVLIPLNSGH